jgi:subtilisin family serine protease
MARRHLALFIFIAALCALLPSLASGVGAAERSRVLPTGTAEPAPVGSVPTRVSVDPLLRRQLARSASGRVAAVVTTWNRAGLRAAKRLGIRGTMLRQLPMILTGSLTARQLRLLEQSNVVRSVWANRRYPILMEDTTWLTRARYTWEKANKDGGLPGLDVTGKDIHIAVIDTGVDVMHEDLFEQVVEFCDTTLAVDANRTSVPCTPKVAPWNPPYLSGTSPQVDCAAVTCDDEGHGTHVSGTIAGNGDASGGRAHPHSTIGIAPDAKLHVYSANIAAALANHQILAAYDDLIAKKVNGIYPLVAVSNSWGGGSGYDPSDPQAVMFKEAYFAGVLSVFAAGNSGPEHNTTSRQCNNPFVVCVAATTKPDSIVMFSSRGRPSEPQDVNRDGVIGANEGPPDNHDRKLGRIFDVGVFRPAVAAPGTNVNSANANTPTCRQTGTGPVGTPAEARGRDCYVQLSGTSMATPHVSGVVALIAEAYHKGHDNKLPLPQIITEILERSSNEMHKLPGWESEEQGSGRIDAYRAVELAKDYPFGMKEPVLGHPVPLYDGPHPGLSSNIVRFDGCTAAGSWTLPRASFPSTGEEGPPIGPLVRYGQHFLVVPERAERLRVTVRWGLQDFHPEHQGANLYLRLWRPGVLPDTAEEPAGGQTRAMADNEATGLVFTGSSRFIEIRAPEETTGSPPEQVTFPESPTLPSGLWILRVYHRAGGGASPCDTGSAENPKLVEPDAYNYRVEVDVTKAERAPTARITEPKEGTVIEDRWTKIGANASQPEQWDGITNFEVQGTETPPGVPEPDTRKVLYFHGNNHVAEASAADEAACDGSPGNDDVVATRCPILLESNDLSADAAAFFSVPSPVLNGAAARNIHDPNWTWYLTKPTTIAGAMTVEFWASCGGCDRELGLSAEWFIRIWADGNLRFARRVNASPSQPVVAQRLEATVNVPFITANQSFTLHVDPVFIDSQNATFIYYDSEQPCQPLADPDRPCDSLVRMPVVATGEPGGGPPPQRVRVTDFHKGLRVAWNDDSTAQKWEIHRSDEPGFIPSPRTKIAVTTGYACVSPQNPTWPSYDRPGRCYDDTGGVAERTYYYRVIAIRNGVRSLASLLAYGMRTGNDRLTLMKVDRLYGPQFWEHATVDATSEHSWHYWWDTLTLITGPHEVSTRGTSQGIPSPKDENTYVLAP